MNAGKAVYGILSANSGVTDIVGTRIFPEIAEQEAATPFVIYQLQSVAPEDTHDGPSKLDEVRFEFLCYADSYNEAADLGEKVRGALDRVSGTYNGVNVESVQFNDVDVDIEYDPRRYSQVLKFTFRIKRDDITIALGTPVTGAVLGDLSDVDVSGVRDGQVIAYNDSTENWEAANAGGGATTLDELTDTQVSGASPGTILSWNGSYWVPIAQSTPPATTDALTEGTTNLYYTEARVSANTDVAANTAKVGITTDQANAITANTAKTSFPGFGTTSGTALEGDTALLQLGTTSSTALAGDTTTISTAQANAITANTAKTSFPGFGTTAGTALEGNTALLQIGTTAGTALEGDTTTITTAQANEITANTAKNSYPSADATKLAGIEENADVTDTANVTAAGALMDSEVTNLAQVKAFDSSDYATAAQGSTADSALQDVVDDTTPQLGGELDTNAKNILFAKTSSTNHSSNGDIIKLGTGSTTQGELCYYTSSGTWVAANATEVGKAGGVLLAIALGTDPDVDGMLLRGMYTLDHDPGTIGDELYVSTTAGDITNDPSGYSTGNIVRVVGYCLDSTNGQIWFNPSNDFIELA